MLNVEGTFYKTHKWCNSFHKLSQWIKKILIMFLDNMYVRRTTSKKKKKKVVIKVYD